MRLLVNSVGSAGHVLPLVAWGLAAREEGHEVHFAVESPLAGIVEQHGFEAQPLPTVAEISDPELAEIARAERQALAGPERLRAVLGMFVDRARAGYAALRDTAEEFRPDVVLRDQAAYGGWALAESIGRPCVTFSFMPRPVALLAQLAGDRLAGLRTEAGLRPDAALSSLEPALHLVGGPPGWFTPDDIGPTGLLVSPPVDFGASSADLPESVVDLPRPCVYVSFGTVVGPQLDALHGLFAGLQALDVSVVTTTPPPPGTESDRVVVEDWVPQLPLMDHVDAVIAHAGYGTVMTALARGVPLVSIPGPMVDNQTNAERLLATGAGRVLQPEEVTPGRVGEDVTAVLESAVHREAALRVKQQLDALPGRIQVVRVIQALTRPP